MSFVSLSRFKQLSSLLLTAGLLAGCNLELANLNFEPNLGQQVGQTNYILLAGQEDSKTFHQKLIRALAANNYTVVTTDYSQEQLLAVIDRVSTQHYANYLTAKLGKLSAADYALINQQVSYNHYLGNSLREQYQKDNFNFGNSFNNIQLNNIIKPLSEIPQPYRNPKDLNSKFQNFFDKPYGAEADVKKLSGDIGSANDAKNNLNKAGTPSSNNNGANTMAIPPVPSLSPAAKLIQTVNNKAAFIPAIEVCRIDLTYKCVARFLPTLNLKGLREESKTLSQFPGTSTAAQGELIYAVYSDVTSRYFGSVDLSTSTKDLYINNEYSPLTTVNRNRITRDAAYTDLANRMVNKLQYVMRQPMITGDVYDNYYEPNKW